MFIVIKTENLNSVTEKSFGVGFIQEEDKFLDFIKDTTEKIGSQHIKNLTFEELQNNTEDYQDGHYLIKRTKEIILVNKYMEVSRGFLFFFTNLVNNVDIISSWTYLPFNGQHQEIKINDKPRSNKRIKYVSQLEYDLLKPCDVNMNDSLIGIIGKKNTGKTELIHKILDKKSDEFIKNTLIITQKNTEYKIKYPDAEVIHYLDAKVVRKHCSSSKKNGCIIIDDMLIPKKIRNTLWETIFHHCRKSRIITTNKGSTFTSKIKKKLDYIFYTQEVLEKEIEKIHNEPGQKIIPNRKEFIEIFKQITTMDGAMTFKRTSSGYQLFRF
jgi:hypothetical protein